MIHWYMLLSDCFHSSTRGNTSLETAAFITKEVRLDVQSLGRRLEKAALFAESVQKGEKAPRDQSMKRAEVDFILRDTKRLLNRIEEVVPLLNLAITTSGAKLSTNLPSTVSPSRLLQASAFLSSGDTQYCMSPFQPVQIGPTFTLSMYMLFNSHQRPHGREGVREETWKEVMHKARLKLRRVPLNQTLDPDSRARRQEFPPSARSDEYSYQILIIEDLDDGRVHDSEEREGYEGVGSAGIREILPVHQISKIFYADTGKLLNINVDEEPNNPVLLFKRDINAIPPRRMVERDAVDFFLQENEIPEAEAEADEEEEEEDEAQAQLNAQLNESASEADINLPSLHENTTPASLRLPQGLDPEWIAFEVYNEDEAADDDEGDHPPSASADTIDPEMMANLSLDPHKRADSHDPPTPRQKTVHSSSPSPQHHLTQSTTVSNPLFNQIRTSLSLLEMLLRLTSLQQFQQQSHLSISDELLNFFLEESSSTGAGGNEQHRQRLRSEARRKVGWDPYDESPVKPRGEEYQHHYSPEDYASDKGGYTSPPSVSRARGFQIRSRENTPMSPLSRASPSVPAAGGSTRGSRSPRDITPHADEAPKRSSRTLRQSTTAETRRSMKRSSTSDSAGKPSESI